ncbi:hypothetical protein [Pseudomonas qingdaonensis]|uniref:hypothetical protein n=1 Tax=Pseudomonas qingdaonensis TaxID=2056231 RepID=UPI001FD2892F|nr:hypothetical protein [Pseudomonas qingdaonensis]
MAIVVTDLPKYLSSYSWGSSNHGLYGYPADAPPDFRWIRSLEERGAWIAAERRIDLPPTEFLREVIAWGGGGSVRARFEAELGQVNLLERFNVVLQNLDEPSRAIEAALDLPGLGLTYGTKVLRFLRPDIHGSLDEQIRKHLAESGDLMAIHHYSWKRGYVTFQARCTAIVAELDQRGIERPECGLARGASRTGWRVADVEMALFACALEANKTKRTRKKS